MTDTSGINATIASKIYANGSGLITGASLAAVLSASGITAWVATQYPPHVASLAALRGFTSSYATRVIRDDYAAGNGAPPLYYAWQATCPNTPDNLALLVAPNAGGAGCWSAAADPNRLDTREWGAVNDSAFPSTCGTDNSAAFQAALNALGEGAVLYNDGVSCLKTNVTVSKSGAGIRSKGGWAGGGHDTAPNFTGVSGLIAGTYGQTLVTFKGGVQAIYGNVFDSVISGNPTGTFALAAIGVDAFSTRNGSFRISGGYFSTSILQADINSTMTEAAGFSTNEIWMRGYQTEIYDGSFFVCNASSLWDCSTDTFYTVSGNTSGAQPVLDFKGADSETILNFNVYDNLAGGPSCVIALRAANNQLQTARNMLFYYVGATNATCPVYAEGTETGKTYSASSNNILYLDTPNNPTPPTLGVATAGFSPPLWWGSSNAPSNFTSASGLVNKTGTSGSIGAGATGTVTFSGAFPAACIAWKVSPATMQVTGCSPTTLTIKNNAVGSASATWQTVGY